MVVGIHDREHDPVPELVPDAPFPDRDEARGLQQFIAPALLFQIPVKSIRRLGCKAKSEMRDRRVREPPLLPEILIAGSALRGLQLLIVKDRRILMNVEELLSAFLSAPVLGLTRRLRKLDMGAVGEALQTFGKGIILIFHQKVDDIAPGTAAEAVIDLLSRTHGKGCRFLSMKRAEPKIVCALFREADVLSDNVDDIVGLTHLFNYGLIIAHAYLLNFIIRGFGK